MVIANYREHYEAFYTLLKKDCCKPILLFKGESGTGKSTLMKHCRSQIKDVHYISVDLGNTTSAMDIFLNAERRLKKVSFVKFKTCLSALNQQFNINVTGNSQTGNYNKIEVELNLLFENTTQEERAERYAILTNAWIDDIHNLKKPCIFLFDDYQKTNNEIKQWIDGVFLSCVADAQKLRVVIAGHDVPHSFEWDDDRSETKELRGVHEAKEWLPVIKEKGRKVPSLDYLKGVCSALQGNPISISQHIDNLPPRTI